VAATVTGAFVILDRASRPMEKMRREAEKLDRAVASVGNRMDRTFDQNMSARIERNERSLRALVLTSARFERGNSRIASSATAAAKGIGVMGGAVGGLEGAMRRLVIVTEGFGRIWTALFIPIKFLAIGAAIGIVVKGVVALGGGLAAMIPQVVGAIGSLGLLIPKMAQASGVAAAALPVYAGLGLAMGTVKLATSDLSEALSGNEQALKRLTPEARAFLKVMQGYEPVVNALRRTAQVNLFPGLTSSLIELRKAAPTVNVLIAGMARELGKLADQAARRFTGREALLDLLNLGGTGTALVGNLGRSAINLASALRHVAVAAQPLARWLGTVVEGWSQYIDRAAQAGRETGRLQRFFERTRDALTTFGHIIRDVFFALRNIFREASGPGEKVWKSIEGAAHTFREWTASVQGATRINRWFQNARHDASLLLSILGNLFELFLGIGRAGRGTGDTLWESLDKTTEAWAKFANSVRGQYRMTLFFDQVRESFRQIALLLEDIGVGVFRLGDQRGFPALIEKIRSLVPIITNVLDTMTQAFGPAMLNFLNTLGRTVEILTGGSGALTILVTLLTRVLDAINRILEAAQRLGPVFTAALTFAGLALALSKIRALAGGWLGVKVAADQAAISEARAASIGGGGFFAFGRGRGRTPTTVPLPVPGGPFSPGGRGNPRVGGAFPLGGVVPETAARTGLLRGGLAAAGRFAWPIAAFGGVLGAFSQPREGNFGEQLGQTAGGIISGATFGLIQRPLTGQEQSDRRVNAILNGGVIRDGGFWHRGPLTTRVFGEGDVERQDVGFNTRLNRLGGENPQRLGQMRAQIGVMQNAIRALRQEEGAAATEAIAGFQGRIAAMRRTISAVRELKAAEREEKRQRRVQASLDKARGMLVDFGNTVNVLERSGVSETDAISRVVSGKVKGGNIIQSLNRLPEEARRQFSRQVLTWLSDFKSKSPELQKQYDKLKTGIVKSFEESGKKVAIVNNRVLTGSKREWTNIKTALTSRAEAARQEVTASFTKIQQSAIGSLTAMGYSAAQAKQIVSSAEGGSVPGYTSAALGTPQAQAGLAAVGPAIGEAGSRAQAALQEGFARGGRIPGVGLRDTVPVMAAPGELFVNRHTEQRVNRMLGGRTTLGQEVAGESTPHHMAKGGRVGAGISEVVGQVLQRFPLSITSTTGGKHAEHSYHYRGMAADIGGSAQAMLDASSWIMASGLWHSLIEGIHNPNLSVKNGQVVSPDFWGASTWAGHADHIHLASGGIGFPIMPGAGAGGGMMMGPVQLDVNRLAPASGIPGVPGVLSTRARRLMAAGVARRVAQRTGMGGDGMGGIGMGGDPSASGPNQMLARQMMLQMGWGAEQWPALKSLWMGESGFNATARNPSSGAYGIPQSLPAEKMAAAGADYLTNPATQIRWGLGYIKGRYGSPAAAYSAWQGRSPHWYGDGGEFVTRGPGLIGVGDKGREHVRITPMRRYGGGRISRAAGRNVQIGQIVVNNHREGDIQAQIVREVGAAFAQLADELDIQPMIGEDVME
jgi:hypothetical protein